MKNISSESINTKDVITDDISQTDCTICFSVYQDPVFVCENQHIFCRKCIDQYINYQNLLNKNCPLCREKIKIEPIIQNNNELSAANQNFANKIIKKLQNQWQVLSRNFKFENILFIPMIIVILICIFVILLGISQMAIILSFLSSR